MKYFNLITAVLIIVGITTTGFAGNDPSIKGQMRTGIQAAMNEHIKHNKVDMQYAIYDSVKGELKWLTLDKLHEGIVKKGDFYVSCADFLDAQGKKYDIDFLVVQESGTYRVLEAVVHAEDGKKRKYHLEDK
jgi:hypothetical protein